MASRDWRDILSTYLTIDKKFDDVSDKIFRLADEVEDHEKRLTFVEARLGSLPSQIGNTCHQVFDQKIAVWRGTPSKASPKELPPDS